jgi:hypothetical protein
MLGFKICAEQPSRSVFWKLLEPKAPQPEHFVPSRLEGLTERSGGLTDTVSRAFCRTRNRSTLSASVRQGGIGRWQRFLGWA